MSKELQLLKMAHRRIKNPEHWTQGASARDKYGEITPATDFDNAHKWCLLGALEASRCKAGIDWLDMRRATAALQMQLGYVPVSLFNDTHEHVKVMELLERTIRELVWEEKKAKAQALR